MTKGWECPKCGQCYAPWVAKCKRCVAQPEQNTTPRWEKASQGQCVVCGGFHLNMTCPDLRVTA